MSAVCGRSSKLGRATVPASRCHRARGRGRGARRLSRQHCSSPTIDELEQNGWAASSTRTGGNLTPSASPWRPSASPRPSVALPQVSLSRSNSRSPSSGGTLITCDICNFVTTRLENMVRHHKQHSAEKRAEREQEEREERTRETHEERDLEQPSEPTEPGVDQWTSEPEQPDPLPSESSSARQRLFQDPSQGRPADDAKVVSTESMVPDKTAKTVVTDIATGPPRVVRSKRSAAEMADLKNRELLDQESSLKSPFRARGSGNKRYRRANGRTEEADTNSYVIKVEQPAGAGRGRPRGRGRAARGKGGCKCVGASRDRRTAKRKHKRGRTRAELPSMDDDFDCFPLLAPSPAQDHSVTSTSSINDAVSNDSELPPSALSPPAEISDKQPASTSDKQPASTSDQPSSSNETLTEHPPASSNDQPSSSSHTLTSSDHPPTTDNPPAIVTRLTSHDLVTSADQVTPGDLQVMTPNDLHQAPSHDAMSATSADWSSGSSCEDDLPDVLTPSQQEKIKKGDLLWVRVGRYPFWPAVVRNVYFKRHTLRKISVGFISRLKQECHKYTLTYTKKKVLPFGGSHETHERLLDLGHQTVYGYSIQESAEYVENYLIRRANGQVTASALEYFGYLPQEGEEDTSSVTSSVETASLELTLTGADLGADRSADRSDDADDDADTVTGDADDADTEMSDRLKACVDRRREKAARIVEECKKEGMKAHLSAIMAGLYPCRRHHLYHKEARTREETAELEDARFGLIDDDDQQHELIEAVLAHFHAIQGDSRFCAAQTKYIHQVLLPEALVHGIQLAQRRSRGAAEEMYRRGTLVTREERSAWERDLLRGGMTDDERAATDRRLARARDKLGL